MTHNINVRHEVVFKQNSIPPRLGSASSSNSSSSSSDDDIMDTIEVKIIRKVIDRERVAMDEQLMRDNFSDKMVYKQNHFCQGLCKNRAG
ncbi:hypothetical protein GIB67_008066 [Kingdonia uniflora]|uniref:Uncharacterized protein n=1 Tax=Kingdonia uniflora TaxID=39325 RepID=A0A7J7MCM6_9MAGN|nr:hypothetical protein GIB67_008066 [Kingdonia uniflora]